MIKLQQQIFANIEFLRIYTEADLNEICNFIKNRIDIYINNKFILLQRNNFYTQEKIARLKRNLHQHYLNIPQDSSDFGSKYERFNDPRSLRVIETEYKLFYNAIHQPDFTPNSFTIVQRNSIFLLSKNDALETTEMHDDIFDNKFHYITYNEIIKKNRVNGTITTDFDLMRSKLNIIINKENIIEKNGINHRAKVPSEFIDVSIPRFEDGGRKEFFEHIHNHGNVPVMLILNNQHTNIFAYSPTELLEDLVYVLTEQNSIEPWIDKKYKKRLIRMAVLVIMDLVYKNNLENNANLNVNYNNYKKFFTMCYKVYTYCNGEIAYPNNILASFIKGYDQQNDLNPNNQRISNYLDTYNTFSYEWFNNLKYLPPLFINESYVSIDKLISHIITWTFLYRYNDHQLLNILNHFNNLFLQTSPDNIVINDVRMNFNQLLKVLFNIGFKLLYFITPYGDDVNERIDIRQELQPLQHGGNQYENIYRKYLKYKNKYLKTINILK